MKKTTTAMLFSLASASVLLASSAIASDVIAEGKALAFDRKLGNCLSCHLIQGGNLPGNAAPPLIGMKARFPDKAKMRAQIWDATVSNPVSIMPPFGRHEILTESEIDKVVEYVYSL